MTESVLLTDGEAVCENRIPGAMAPTMIRIPGKFFITIKDLRKAELR
jgi:hypothetical protein